MCGTGIYANNKILEFASKLTGKPVYEILLKYATERELPDPKAAAEELEGQYKGWKTLDSDVRDFVANFIRRDEVAVALQS